MNTYNYSIIYCNKMRLFRKFFWENKKNAIPFNGGDSVGSPVGGKMSSKSIGSANKTQK